MKILHLISQTPDFTGSGKYIQEIINQCSLNRHENFLIAGVQDSFKLPENLIPEKNCDFIHFSVKDLDFPIPGMSDIMPYNSSVFSSLTRTQLEQYFKTFETKIASSIEKFRPDIIHSHHLWIASSIAAKLSGKIPVVTTCHGTCLRQHHLCPEISNSIKKDLNMLDSVIALSREQQHMIQTRIGIEKTKISIISGGYNPEIFYPETKPDTGTVNLLYAGKITSSKGVPWLLKSLEKIHQQNFILHIAGNAPDDEKQFCLSFADNLQGKAVYHGTLSHEELAALMRQCHIFILPSFYEGLPLVLIEALASGCKIVTTALPGVHEIFTTEHEIMINLFELPELETIDRPFKQDEPRLETQLAGLLEEIISSTSADPQPDMDYVKKIVSDFTWDTIFEKTGSIYQGCLNA